MGGGDGAERGSVDPKGDFLAAERKANITFHVCMTFASIYMCMLYTGWGDDQISSDAKARGTTAMVVNILCVWVTAILYGWTLVAPKMCHRALQKEMTTMMRRSIWKSERGSNTECDSL